MAKSTLVTVADEVASLIEATILAEDGTVERFYVPSKALDEIDDLIASVVARDEGRKPSERIGWQRDYVIDIAIRQRVDTDAETDSLGDLMETVANILEDTPLGTIKARLVELKLMGPDVAILDQHKAFAGWIRATYRTMRRLS